MRKKTAIDGLAALAQETRFDVFRLLVREEPQGLAAGTIAARLRVPAPTLSSHLNIMHAAGMVERHREGRSIVYRASIARFRELTLFLFKDCCQGRADICGPVAEALGTYCQKGVCNG